MKKVFSKSFSLSFYLKDTSIKSFLTSRLRFLRLEGAGWEMGFLWVISSEMFSENRVNEKA